MASVATLCLCEKMSGACPCALKIAGGNEILAYNLQFRGGPCDICGGSCLCLSNDLLIERILSGLKPVGTFPFYDEKSAIDFESSLCKLGLSTWLGRNKWGMFVVVASKLGITSGVHHVMAFSNKFINEEMDVHVTGILYGYPPM